MSGGQILKRWRLARTLPWGTRLFSFILSFFVPYASTIRPRIEVLEPFVQKDVVARLQRARAARLARRPSLASSDLYAFAEQFGHVRSGNLHSRAMLAER